MICFMVIDSRMQVVLFLMNKVKSCWDILGWRESFSSHSYQNDEEEYGSLAGRGGGMLMWW